MKVVDKVFQIGSFCFRVVCENEIPIPEKFLLFEASQEAEPAFTYRLRIVESLSAPAGKLLAGRPDLTAFRTETGEGRLIGSLGGMAYYACYLEVSKQQADIQLSIHELSDLRYDTVFTSLFALESRMIRRQSLILHCAYMVYQGKAILFSAPSETGKSTQAGLWERYRGSHTVNGDRALLRKIDNRWTACGWPVCGSSEICSLGDTPVYAIVMLRQGKINHVERLSPFRAFTQIYAQVTINQWNREFVQKAIDAIEDLIKQVPVWQLTCDISEDAVKCLETALFPETADEGGDRACEVWRPDRSAD